MKVLLSKAAAATLIGIAALAIQGVAFADAPNAKLGDSGFWSHGGPEWSVVNGKWQRVDGRGNVPKSSVVSARTSKDGVWVDKGGDIGIRPDVHGFSMVNGTLVHDDGIDHATPAPVAPRTVSPGLVP